MSVGDVIDGIGGPNYKSIVQRHPTLDTNANRRRFISPARRGETRKDKQT
jgi:hypothetical protein